MMPRFEFGHFYKFAVSVGLVLIGLGLALPWLVLRDTNGLRIPARELTEMTPEARNILEKKQADQQWVVNHYAYASVASATLGLVIVGYGALKWLRRQRVLDETEDLGRDTAQATLSKMNPNEIEERRHLEAQEATLEEKDEAPTLSSASPSSDPSESVSVRVYALQETYRRVEERLDFLLGAAFSSTHDALVNVAFESIGRLEADLLLRARASILPSYAVEHKLATSVTSVDKRLVEGMSKAIILATEASHSLVGEYVAVLMLVVGDESTGRKKLNEAAIRARTDQTRRGSARDLRVVVIQLEHLQSIEPAQLRAALEAPTGYADQRIQTF